MAGQKVIVSVLADTKKFSSAMKRLSRETGISKLGNGFKNLGRRIGSMVKTGVKALAALGIAIAGLAIKGGFDRMMKIEDAQAKLKGLGHDAKSVERIMDDALASVKGTAFGLDTAATVASTAVAAGIKPGQQLEKYLRLTADAATIAGVSMDEMGDILNKTTTNTTLQTNEMQQLQKRGLPVMEWLSEAYGKSATDMQKMVSNNEVSAERFREILEDKIGGAALKSGDTTRGAFENMKAALSRVGVSLLEDVFPMFKDLFGGITTWLDDLTDKLKPVGQAFSTWLEGKAIPAVKNLGKWIGETLWPALKNVWSIVSGAFTDAWATISAAFGTAGDSAGSAGKSIGDTLVSALNVLAPIIATVVRVVGDLVAWLIRNKEIVIGVAAVITSIVITFQAFSKVLAIARAATVAFAAGMKLMQGIGTVAKAVSAATGAVGKFSLALLTSPIMWIVAAVAALVAGLVLFFTKTETGRQIVAAAWEGIKTAIDAVVEFWNTQVWPVLEAGWQIISDAASAAADWYQEHVAPIFEAVGELLGAIFERIQQAVAFMWAAIQPVLAGMGEGWQMLWDVIQAVWNKIGPPIMTIIKTAFNVLKNVLGGIWKNIKTVIETTLGVIKGIIKTVTSLIKGDWSGAWNAIKGIGQTIWNGIKSVVSNSINAVKGVITSVVNGVKSFWSGAWNSVKTTALNIFNGIKTGVQNKLNSMMTYVRSIPSKIKGVFSGAGSWLISAGKNLISGLINGIKNMFGSVKNTLSGLTDKIFGWKGPPERDRVLLNKPGEWIIDGLIDGLESKYRDVARSLGGLTRNISRTDMGRLEAPMFSPTPALAGSAAGRGGPAPVIKVYALMDGPDIGRRVARALDAYERTNGRR